MYLKEISGVCYETIYKTVSNNRRLNDFTIIITDKSEKELRLRNLEYIESICTVEEFNNLLESIKIIWKLDYPDYNIIDWKTKSNSFFLKWLGVELNIK